MQTPEAHEGFERIFPIETVEVAGGNSLSYSPERGGIITSLKLAGGTEVLYLDEATFANPTVSVKGGVPILFPNAGPLDDPRFPGLKQHGFGRTTDKWRTQPSENGFSEVLISDDETRKMYPYDFVFEVRGTLNSDGSFLLEQLITNPSKTDNLPVVSGFHPYFRVPKNEKGNIKFEFEGGQAIEQAVGDWANNKAVFADNPAIRNPDAEIKVIIPSLGTLVMKYSTEYKRIWVWSLPDKDFVCVEPIMGDIEDFAKKPTLIKPGETLKAGVTIKLIKN
jgi:galactose mutarotase-like enzyme